MLKAQQYIALPIDVLVSDGGAEAKQESMIVKAEDPAAKR